MAKKLLEDFGMIVQKIAMLFFSQSNDFFLLRDGTVLEINSLCGTRTFKKYGYLDGIKRVQQQKADYTIIRDERERLLSAYNKKVISRDDWRKSLLRLSTGIKYQLKFDEFIRVLISRKEKSLFIDKHFKPSSASGKPILISELGKTPTLKPYVTETIGRRAKSSEQVAKKSILYKTNITASEEALITYYIGLFNA